MKTTDAGSMPIIPDTLTRSDRRGPVASAAWDVWWPRIAPAQGYFFLEETVDMEVAPR